MTKETGTGCLLLLISIHRNLGIRARNNFFFFQTINDTDTKVQIYHKCVSVLDV